MIDLKTYQPADAVIELLGTCMWPDKARIEREYVCYLKEEKRVLLGVEREGNLAGLAGWRFTSEYTVTLLHLAVSPSFRSTGIGSAMVKRFWADNPALRSMEAETDRNAVGFYRKVGFEVVSLGEKYPGVERFACTLRR